MAIKINNFARKAYLRYISAGLTPAGACALIANQDRESDGFYSDTLEYLLLKRFREDGNPTTKEQYVKDVDSGKISRAAFLSPRGHHYGFGLCQWTTDSRKAGLYDRAKERGVSIADEQLALDYTIWELQNLFPSVLKVLTTSTDINYATSYTLQKFEAPANWQNFKATRQTYAHEYYSEFTKGGTVVAEVQKVIDLGKKYANDRYREVGGTSNNNIFSTVVNQAGLMGCQNQAWCGTFQFALDVMCFGMEKALELWHMTKATYRAYGVFETRNLFKSKGKLSSTPKVGNIIIYSYSHMGRVIKVYPDGSFDSLEGNTTLSGDSRDGGYVAIKRKTKSDKVQYFGVIDYDIDVSTTPVAQPFTGNPIIRDGQVHANNFIGSGLETDGYYGPCSDQAAKKVVQHALNLDYNCGLDVDGVFGNLSQDALGIHYVEHGETQYMVTALEILLMLHGYDPHGVEYPGQFGDGLKETVIKFQQDHTLDTDGVAGRKTFLTLLGIEF